MIVSLHDYEKNTIEYLCDQKIFGGTAMKNQYMGKVHLGLKRQIPMGGHGRLWVRASKDHDVRARFRIAYSFKDGKTGSMKNKTLDWTDYKLMEYFKGPSYDEPDLGKAGANNTLVVPFDWTEN